MYIRGLSHGLLRTTGKRLHRCASGVCWDVLRSLKGRLGFGSKPKLSRVRGCVGDVWGRLTAFMLPSKGSA